MAEPYCLAMVICDAVHQDKATRKFTILGTFDNISANNFPAPVDFCVYFALTDGLGDIDLRLQLVDAAGGVIDAFHEGPDDSRVFLAKTEIHLEDPRMVLESAVHVIGMLPKSGIYFCELWADRNLLMSRRFTATELEPPVYEKGEE